MILLHLPLLLLLQLSADCLAPRAGSVMLLLEVLMRRVLSLHIICSNSTGVSSSSSNSSIIGGFTSSSSSSSSSTSNSGGSSDSLHSSAAATLWHGLLGALTGRQGPGGVHVEGLLQAMSTAAIDQPQLQPGLLALLASLHKLSRQLSMGTHTIVGEAAAPCAHTAIDMLSDAGVPGMVDLCTWRAMIAPWVILIGLYCCQMGRRLQQWLHDQQQVLQQPSSSVSCNGADAGAALHEFSETCDALQVLSQNNIISCIKQVGSLWESGSDSTLEGGGLQPAEYVAKWQQWQQCAAAGGQQQQRQQSAATAAAGVQAYAATAATGHPSVVVLTGQQQLPQQQQVQVPVYGSLKEECGTLFTAVVRELRDSRDVVRNTQQHLKCCSLHGTIDAQQCSSSSSSSISKCRDGPSSDVHDNDREHELDQVVAAAKQKVKEAATILSSMQACLEYPGFARLAMQLQEVGEAICAKVPVPYMCNNPRCTCMDGASELQLVGGKACVCGGCRVAR
jgi:hypothetical protein